MPHYRDWFAAASSKAVIHPNYRPEASKANAYVDEDVDGFLKLGDIKGEYAANWRVDSAGRFTTGGGGDSLHSWRDVRDHNHGKFAEALTNPDHAFGLDVGPVNQTADIWTNGGASTFTVDALLQQASDVAGVAGLISPDQMRPVDFTHAMEWFAPGSAVKSLVPNSDRMFSPISGEGVFAQRDGLGTTASVIVGDNHF